MDIYIFYNGKLSHLPSYLSQKRPNRPTGLRRGQNLMQRPKAQHHHPCLANDWQTKARPELEPGWKGWQEACDINGTTASSIMVYSICTYVSWCYFLNILYPKFIMLAIFCYIALKLKNTLVSFNLLLKMEYYRSNGKSWKHWKSTKDWTIENFDFCLFVSLLSSH